MKPHKLPRMNSDEIDALIDSGMICRIAFKGEDFPYIAPFQYVKHQGNLYFHFTDYGRKMRLIKKDNRVCVSVERLADDLSEFKFVVLNGRLVKVDDSKEQAQVLQKIAEKGSQHFSNRFLAVHGLRTNEEWSSLSSERNMIIFKLLKDEELGLKSP